MSTAFATLLSFVLVLVMLTIAWFVRLELAFPIVLVLFVLFCMLVGVAICKRPIGILITEQNVVSLSRFQTVLWTIVVLSAFVVIAMARIKNGVIADEDSRELADPLNIALGKDLLALLGISAASLVGSPLITATKRSKTPDKNAVPATAKQMVRLNNIPNSLKQEALVSGSSGEKSAPASKPPPTKFVEEIEKNAEGIVYKNPEITDASFTDLFEGNEIGNAAHVDLGKVQMFFITVMVAVAYTASLWDLFSTNAIYGASFAFPTLSNGMVALLGISNAGYLATKTVDHTPHTPRS